MNPWDNPWVHSLFFCLIGESPMRQRKGHHVLNWRHLQKQAKKWGKKTQSSLTLIELSFTGWWWADRRDSGLTELKTKVGRYTENKHGLILLSEAGAVFGEHGCQLDQKILVGQHQSLILHVWMWIFTSHFCRVLFLCILASYTVLYWQMVPISTDGSTQAHPRHTVRPGSWTSGPSRWGSHNPSLSPSRSCPGSWDSQLKTLGPRSRRCAACRTGSRPCRDPPLPSSPRSSRPCRPCTLWAERAAGLSGPWRRERGVGGGPGGGVRSRHGKQRREWRHHIWNRASLCVRQCNPRYETSGSTSKYIDEKISSRQWFSLNTRLDWGSYKYCILVIYQSVLISSEGK